MDKMPGAECEGPGKTLLNSENSKKISKTVQTRSDPSGGGGFNRAARSPPGRVGITSSIFDGRLTCKHPKDRNDPKKKPPKGQK